MWSKHASNVGVQTVPSPDLLWARTDTHRLSPSSTHAQGGRVAVRCYCTLFLFILHQQQRRERNLLVGTVPYCTSVGFCTSLYIHR